MGQHPAQQMADIFTGTGLVSYLEAGRLHAVAGYDAYQEAGHLLRAAIRNSGGSWSFDTRLLARRLCRPILFAGDLELEIARSLSAAGSVYRMWVSESSSGGNTGRTRFDPSK